MPRSRPRWCSTDLLRPRGRAARVAGPRALPEPHVAVHGRDPRRHQRSSIAASARPRTGVAQRFTMDAGSARAVRVAFKRLYDDGLAYRGETAHQLVPGLPDEPLRPGGRSPRRRAARSGPCATTWCATDGSPDPDDSDHGGHDPPGDDPGRHGGGRPPGRRALRGPGRAAVRIPFVDRDRADHRGRRRRARVRHRRGQDHARPTTTTTSRPASATACR